MRVYRALLHLYPASFREEYGGELAAVFRARRRDTSGVAVVGFWVRTIVDTVASASAAHVDIARQDLRYTARSLNRSRGFAAAAVLIAALGIGANTAVFSLADHSLVRPLPFADPERLVNLWEDHSYRGYARVEPSPANFRDWARATRSFEAMAAYSTLSVNLTGRSDPQRLEGAAVTAGLFPLLGARPALGRRFAPADDLPGAPGTVLLGNGVWHTLFAGDPAVVGRQVTLDNEPYVVIGVMPPGFCYPNRDVTFWTTERFGEEMYEDRTNNYLHVVARLKRNVSLRLAATEMRVVASALERTYPKENARVGVTLRWIRDDVSPQARLLLLALAGAAVCVLLIACTNLANLLITRAMTRQAELSVRSALGAGRNRLVRQLLTEAVVLAAAGGAVGIAIAASALPLLARLVPTALPIAATPRIDGRALAIAGILTALTALGFGVLPSLRACRSASQEGLKAGARAIGPMGTRLRSALVVVEVVCSVVLLAAVSLLLQTLWRVQSIDPGFRASGVLTLRTALPTPKYEPVARRTRFYSQVTSEIRALPGVTGAAYITGLPLVMRGGIWPVAVDGRPLQPGDRQAAILRFLTPGYFDAMGIRIEAGRDIAESDVAAAPRVAVVSRSLVRQFWPDRNPLGRQLQIASESWVVVGVVGDVRVRGLERDTEPQVYLPSAQHGEASVSVYAPKDLVVRFSGNPSTLLPAIRRIVHRADPEQPISGVQTLSDLVDAESAPRLVQARVLGVFAALALVLAAAGIHAVLSYGISNRRREIGVRMALGATRFRILSAVVVEAFTLSAIGTVLGLLAAFAVGQWMRSLLVGVAPANVWAFGLAVALAMATALIGSALPAWQAARVDPASVMRTE